MADFRCKMCGGTMVTIKGQAIMVCEYCGSKESIPTKDYVLSNTSEKVGSAVKKATTIINDKETWKKLGNINTTTQDLKNPERQSMYVEGDSAAYRFKGLCQHCGGNFKGTLKKKCSSCGKPKDY